MNPRYKEIQDEMAAIDVWIALCKKLGINTHTTIWVIRNEG